LSDRGVSPDDAELIYTDGVEPFGRLPVPFTLLRPEFPRPEANWIGRVKLELVILAQPEFSLRLSLENPDHNRTAGRESCVGDFVPGIGRRRRAAHVRSGNRERRK
jgi:hypothetical protein